MYNRHTDLPNDKNTVCLLFETFNTAEIIIPIGLVTSSLVAACNIQTSRLGVAVQIVLLIYSPAV